MTGVDYTRLVLRNEALERAVLADPEALDAYIVYGDWLSMQGDPRGELIALSCQDHPIDAYVEKHRAELLGPLAFSQIKWRRGFADEILLRGNDWDPKQIAELLLHHPICLLLRKLEIHTQLDAISRALILPPSLHELSLGSFTSDPGEACPIDAVERLAPQLSSLDSLRINGPTAWMQFMDPLRAHLRSLGVRFPYLLLASTRPLFTAPWPRLERLLLWFGGDTTDHRYFRNMGYPWERDPEVELAPLLDASLFPNLRKLELLDIDFQNHLSAFSRLLKGS